MEDRLSRPSAASASPRAGAASVAALAVILAVTAAWWVLALWPAADAPAWLDRTRAVCFGAKGGGLPDAAGWAALIGQPVVLIGILVVGWGREVAVGLRRLWRGAPGRAALLSVTALLLAAAAGVAGRVSGGPGPGAASGGTDGSGARPGPFAVVGTAAAAEEPAAAYPRLDRTAPPLELLDQDGRRFSLADVAGRPVLVTFAYAHCETVCPAVVGDVLAASRRLRREGVPALAVVVTLDPWRDTPARLPHIARGWHLGPGERVLGGTVPDVERTLDAWDVPRARDVSDGQIAHPRLVYLVDGRGRLAFAANAGTEALVALARRL